MNVQDEFDIGIIGGGPAGSSSALLLSKAGFNVCLFEKKRFPRETVCGEFLSRETYNFLKEYGLENKFLALNPNPIKSLRIFFNNDVSVLSDLTFTGYGLKRSSFDSLILDNAIINGTTVFQPSDVYAIIKDRDNYTIEFLNDIKEKCSVLCKYVIAAYGKQNSLDKAINRKFVNKKSGFNGIKFHFDIDELPGFNKSEIQIYTTESMYCGVNAVNDNKVTICFLEDRKKTNISSREHLRALAKQNINFSKLLSAKFESLIGGTELYGTGNVYFGERGLINNGIFFTGDAASVIAPLAGDGISIALLNSKLLEKIFVWKRDNYHSRGVSEYLYAQLWYRLFSTRIYTALYIQKILLNRSLNKVSGKLAHLFPGLLKYFIHHTRG